MVDKRKYQDRTIHSTTAKEGDTPRDSQADEHEVTHRAVAREPVGSRHAQANPAPAAPAGQANTAAPSHEQSPALRFSSSDADRKAMSQNGARISDFEG